MAKLSLDAFEQASEAELTLISGGSGRSTGSGPRYGRTAWDAITDYFPSLGNAIYSTVSSEFSAIANSQVGRAVQNYNTAWMTKGNCTNAECNTPGFAQPTPVSAGELGVLGWEIGTTLNHMNHIKNKK